MLHFPERPEVAFLWDPRDGHLPFQPTPATTDDSHEETLSLYFIQFTHTSRVSFKRTSRPVFSQRVEAVSGTAVKAPHMGHFSPAWNTDRNVPQGTNGLFIAQEPKINCYLRNV